MDGVYICHRIKAFFCESLLIITTNACRNESLTGTRKTYIFRVSWVSRDGFRSARSTYSRASQTRGLSAPTALKVTVGDPAAAHLVCKHTHAVLHVKRPDDDGGVPILRYWLIRERILSGRGRVAAFDHPLELEVRNKDFGPDGELIMSNILPGATYRVRVAAENVVGKSPWSHPVIVSAGGGSASSSKLETTSVEISSSAKTTSGKNIRIYGAHVHLDEPCHGPIAIVCPHSQQVTVERGVEYGCKGTNSDDVEGMKGIHGHHQHHFNSPHNGEEAEIEGWLLQHSPKTHDVRGELVIIAPEHRYGCQELPIEERRRVIGRFVSLSYTE